MRVIITYYSYLKFELNSSHHHRPEQLQVEVSESLSESTSTTAGAPDLPL